MEKRSIGKTKDRPVSLSEASEVPRLANSWYSCCSFLWKEACQNAFYGLNAKKHVTRVTRVTKPQKSALNQTSAHDANLCHRITCVFPSASRPSPFASVSVVHESASQRVTTRHAEGRKMRSSAFIRVHRRLMSSSLALFSVQSGIYYPKSKHLRFGLWRVASPFDMLISPC